MGQPGSEDLTPGDFRGGMVPLDVDTDSLASFGSSFARNAQTYFRAQTAARIGEIRGGANSCAQNKAIGKSDVLHELLVAGVRIDSAGTAAGTLSSDLTSGSTALGNAAAWMAEQYGSTDKVNATTVATVTMAFQPPPGGTTTRHVIDAGADRAPAPGVAPMRHSGPQRGAAQPDPYYTPPAEADYDPSYAFVPPADPDVTTLAPSQGEGGSTGALA